MASPRIVGLETEFALGFHADDPFAPAPTQEALFRALLEPLERGIGSCDALYYKGGKFLGDGSLIHFEISQLADTRVGLLEWATPECRGGLEAATYAKAQERSLIAAIPAAEASLAEQGFVGRLIVLKNNEDRLGNSYGTHESYDVRERPPTWRSRLFRWLLHPPVLALLLVTFLIVLLPMIAIVCVFATLLVLAQLVGVVPGLGRLGQALQSGITETLKYVSEPGPRRGSGVLARVFLIYLRLGGRLFSLTGREVMFSGHAPALLPFLATRPVFAGAGHLDPEGRFHLTPRARIADRTIAAFIYGPRRPLIDMKEFFYRRPFDYACARKRLHLLAGDANRAEYAETLKLAVTEVVLNAIEAGALDALAGRLELRDGVLGVFRATSSDPSLATIVARDRLTGQHLTAVAVQRCYLEATWAWCRERPQVSPATKDALVRWNFVLDQLQADPLSLDRELDWVVKLRLLSATLLECGLADDVDAAWAKLQRWGKALAVLDAAAPDLVLVASPSAAVEAAVRAVGGGVARQVAQHIAAEALDWGELPAVRSAWLRLKTVDLKYHELSRDGGYYDWLASEGKVARVLEPERIEEARTRAPRGTRAAVRGAAISGWPASNGEARDAKGRELKAGWEGLEVSRPLGEPLRFPLLDPDRAEPSPGLARLLEEVSAETRSPLAPPEPPLGDSPARSEPPAPEG